MSDSNTATAFQKTHPLDFNLFDDDDQPVLYILDDPIGNNLHLEIRNTSSYSINTVPPTADEASATVDNHNFELRFRPGVLYADATALGKLALAKVSLDKTSLDTSLWRIGYANQPNGTVALYILATKAQPALTLAPGSSLKFTIQNISANGGNGARGTRVEFKYQGLAYSGDAPQEIKGTRLQHISIVNERGKKNIPLHVGFLGSNTILNDGKSGSKITLRITNILKDDFIPLSQTASDPSKFILSFDVQDTETKEWALMEAGQLEDVQVEVKFTDDSSWKVIKEKAGKQGESPEWIIENKDLKQLDPRQHIQIKITGIKSSLPSGLTNLYIRYENLPGYWDGQFIATLEKSNLVQRDQSDTNGNYAKNSYIGIGTSTPGAKLTVQAGDTDSIVNANGKALFVSCAMGEGKSRDGGIEFRHDNLSQGIGFGYNTIYATGNNANQELTIQSKGTGNLILNPFEGRVGIGTSNPDAKLEVAGDIRLGMSDLYFPDKNYGIGYYGNDQSSKKFAKPELDGPVKPGKSGVDGPVVYGYSGGALGSTDGGKKLVLRWNQNGKVGIGTNNPLSVLSISSVTEQKEVPDQVIGELTFVGFNRSKASASILAKSPGWDDVSHLILKTSSNYEGAQERMRITSDGNVGIGTMTPDGHLEIKNNRRDWIFLRQERRTGGGGFHFHNPWGDEDGDERNRLEIAYMTGAGEHKWGQFVIHGPSGNVGIGTDTPGKGKLEINGTASGDKPGFSYKKWLSIDGLHTGGSPNQALSIYASGDIGVSAVFVFSDERVKKIQRRSDGAADLRTLLDIEVTDFLYKDVIGKSGRACKKVIAQQVEKVFPQAVSKQTDVVPDIYKQASLSDGWVELATDLKTGERVRLISEHAEGVYEVLEAAKDKFRADFKPEGEKVFVFGREVNDFRSVDYDAIAMLNVSATQQLKKEKDTEVEALQSKCAELLAANDALTERLQLLESKMETGANDVAAAKKTA
jgi:hypothetical protein